MSTTPPQDAVFWTKGLAGIVSAKSDEMKRAQASASRALEKAEAALETADRKFGDAKQKFGKNSGHKDYQRAESAVHTARRHRKHSQRSLESMRQVPITINREQVILDKAVRVFLDGEVPQSRCGSMKLSVSPDGNLNIFFNKDTQEIRGRRHDGHFIIKPNGYMHAMHLR